VRDIIRALSAEILKLKRTLALLASFGAPLVVCGMSLLVALKIDKISGNWNGDAWMWHINNISIFWGMMVLPMTIALISGLLSSYEHNSQGWKHLFALPVRRSSILIAKFTVHHILLIISTVTMISAVCSVGFLVHILRPEFGFSYAPPLGHIIELFGKFYLASWMILALLQWLAIYIPNFSVALGVGIAGTFIGMVSATGWFQKLWPWKLIMNTQATIAGVPELALILGMIGGLIFMIAAIIHLSRREVI
jgi:lantibiotic transport system permease protein